MPSWTVAVVGNSTIKDKTTYNIRIVNTDTGRETRLAKRYSELRTFHEELITRYPETASQLLNEFPLDKMHFSTMATIAKERSASLEAYLRGLFVSPAITDGAVLYKTMSVCPVCMLGERRGVHWLPARVMEVDGQCRLVVACGGHGDVATLYCADAALFRRLIAPQVLRTDPGAGPCLSHHPLHMLHNHARLECNDVVQALIAKSTIRTFEVFQGGGFVSSEQLKLACREAGPFLRVRGRLASDMVVLNDLLLSAIDVLPADSRLLLELSWDRMVALCSLPSTVLLRRRCVPVITYFVQPDTEALARVELATALAALEAISDIQLVVSLHVEQPLPKLLHVMDMLRRHSNTVRVIDVVLSRPPAQMMAAVASHSQDRIALTASVDLSALVGCVTEACEGALSADHFMSLDTLTFLPNLFRLAGFGLLHFYPSAVWGAFSLLLTTPDHVSVSLASVFDLAALMPQLGAVLLADAPVPEGAAGPALLLRVARARRILKSCVRAGVSGALVDALLAPEQGGALWATAQCMLVRRDVDLACLDLHHVAAPALHQPHLRDLLLAAATASGTA